MKTHYTLKIVALVAVAAVALLTGCKKQDGHSENDGHNHGKAAVEDHSGHAKTNAPAQDDHTGHNHGLGEHTTPPAK